LASVDNLNSPVAKRLTPNFSNYQAPRRNYSEPDKLVHGRSISQRRPSQEHIVAAEQKATHQVPVHQPIMAQGDGVNVQQRFSNIEAELQRIRDVQAKFEQASQIQNERIEELERVLNPLSGSQPEVSTAPSSHERGQMCDDVSMASNNIHDSDASEDYLERESPNEDVSDGDFAKDDDGSSDGSNIYDA
jgi:hypothetical protein